MYRLCPDPACAVEVQERCCCVADVAVDAVEATEAIEIVSLVSHPPAPNLYGTCN